MIKVSFFSHLGHDTKKREKKILLVMQSSDLMLFVVDCVDGAPGSRMVWCGSPEQESRDPRTVTSRPAGRNAGSGCDDPPPGHHVRLLSYSCCPPSRPVPCFPAGLPSPGSSKPMMSRNDCSLLGWVVLCRYSGVDDALVALCWCCGLVWGCIGRTKVQVSGEDRKKTETV